MEEDIFEGKKVVPRPLIIPQPGTTAKEMLPSSSSDAKLMDTRTYLKTDLVLEETPEKITGSYTVDYNITYLDSIIKKKLLQEKFTLLPKLKKTVASLKELIMRPQTYIQREHTLTQIKVAEEEIRKIETGEKLRVYLDKTSDIINSYLSASKIKKVMFDQEDQDPQTDEDALHRISLIEKYLDIAGDYIQLDIIRVTSHKSDVCTGCGASLARIALSDEGSLRCPECFTEHSVIITAKLSKDGARINMNTNLEDESIENFLRAFTRYQGLQCEQPDEKVYEKLDKYFTRNGRPTGAQIRELPLDSRGLRGDTNHKMLWDALSHIGHSEYYEDTNLIGHVYWGWELPNVSHLKERLIDKYIKTQKVFYQIPIEERNRNSSLGTQYRLWRHLQLEGHECYMDEFKIAENPESLRTHNNLWKQMCDGAGDPDIFYIP